MMDKSGSIFCLNSRKSLYLLIRTVRLFDLAGRGMGFSEGMAAYSDRFRGNHPDFRRIYIRGYATVRD